MSYVESTDETYMTNIVKHNKGKSGLNKDSVDKLFSKFSS